LTPTTVVTGLGGRATALGAGDRHTCALLADGRVQCWGYNRAGQLGDGTTTQRSTPTTVTGLGGRATALAAGWSHTCALLADGRVQCWGNNSLGQLGDGTTTQRSTPTTVTGLGGMATALAAGGEHTCALLEGGRVQCWGYNSAGQLGDGTTTSRSTPVTVVGLP
jgi:alpha-tubulin suppressor-like RCC1 family protein